ncbi:HepT-like ribonuclease domain-containing protein [Petrimonas sp.]|uniref:HepT-like ribonuclease domain-containing protein n=1 Tax=Petrimonas sp. TaxID=2023866 RepID=UPI003F50F9E8
MDEYVSKHLGDILIAIDEIDDFFVDSSKKYDEYLNDLKLRRAVERNIEIIGEAMNRILKSDTEITITNARKIVDTRNYVAHGYDSLLPDILWSIVINHLPLLKKEVELLLQK